MTIYQKLHFLNTLLIDDDQWIRNSLRLVFESEGCPLTAVETAEEGLQVVQNTAVDVIICDYQLPGMDGLQFFKEIRDRNICAVKILITAYGSREVYAQARFLGISDILEKPFTAGIIEQTLHRLLHSQNSSNDVS